MGPDSVLAGSWVTRYPLVLEGTWFENHGARPLPFSWELQRSRGLSLAEQSLRGPGGGGLRGGASARKARTRIGGLWHWPGVGTWLMWEQEAHSMTLGFNGHTTNANPGLSLRSVYGVTLDIPDPSSARALHPDTECPPSPTLIQTPGHAPLALGLRSPAGVLQWPPWDSFDRVPSAGIPAHSHTKRQWQRGGHRGGQSLQGRGHSTCAPEK